MIEKKLKEIFVRDKLQQINKDAYLELKNGKLLCYMSNREIVCLFTALLVSADFNKEELKIIGEELIPTIIQFLESVGTYAT